MNQSILSQRMISLLWKGLMASFIPFSVSAAPQSLKCEEIELDRDTAIFENVAIAVGETTKVIAVDGGTGPKYDLKMKRLPNARFRGVDYLTFADSQEIHLWIRTDLSGGLANSAGSMDDAAKMKCERL